MLNFRGGGFLNCGGQGDCKVGFMRIEEGLHIAPAEKNGNCQNNKRRNAVNDFTRQASFNPGGENSAFSGVRMPFSRRTFFTVFKDIFFSARAHPTDKALLHRIFSASGIPLADWQIRERASSVNTFMAPLPAICSR